MHASARLVSVPSLFTLLLVGLVGCTISTGDQTEPPPSKPSYSPQRSGDEKPPVIDPAPISSPVADSPELIASREAFGKTLVAGKKSWNVKTLKVQFERRAKDDSKKEKWTATCTMSKPLSLEGAHPSVTLSAGGLDCGPTHKPSEFTYFSLITSRMRYSAAYIPALPAEPNQFRLDLVDAASLGVFRWNSRVGLNSNLREGVAFFNFLGETLPLTDWSDRVNYYVEMSIETNATKSAETLKLTFRRDEGMTENTEITATADLERQ